MSHRIMPREKGTPETRRERRAVASANAKRLFLGMAPVSSRGQQGSHEILVLGPPTMITQELMRGLKIGLWATIPYLAGMLAVGTNLIVALLFSGGILAGTISVAAGGGVRSMMGLLNFSLLFKYLLLSLALKIFYLQAADSFLGAPTVTPLVLCLAFIGIMAGTVAIRLGFGRRQPLCLPIVDPKQLFALYWLCMVAGVFTVLLATTSLGTDVGGDYRVGGVLGFARYALFLRDYAVSVALLYAHYSGKRRFLTHPLVLQAFIVCAVVSLASGSKSAIMNPIFYAGLTAFTVKGVRFAPVYIIGVFGWLLLSQLVFPAINYTRTAEFSGRGGAAEGSSFQLYATVLKEAIFDPAFRREAKLLTASYYSENKYFDTNLGPLARFALIGNADNLIAPTFVNHEFTGWSTIWYGIRMLPPRFLYPNKPYVDTSLMLSITAGLASVDTEGVPLAFGFQACMYNAFGLPGALIGCAVLIAAFYGWAMLFFGNTANGNVWLPLVVGLWHQSLCEYTISGIIAGLWYTVIGYGLYNIVIKVLVPKRQR
jgi:hypothetical protein